MPTLSPQVGFKPLPEMHIVTLGTQGADCFEQAKAMAYMRPQLKIMIGSLMAWCQDDRLPNAPSYWQRPWVQHCWLVDEDGQVIDPALRNLQTWADATEITLPCSVEDMTATVVPWDVDTIQGTVHELINCKFNDTPEHPLIYLPGAIFGQSTDLEDYGRHFFGVWSGAAGVTATRGGLSRDHLEKMLRVVDAELAKGPGKAKPKGFG